MTLKQATFLAIVSLIVQLIIPFAYMMETEFYTVIRVFGILSTAGLLPFFILIYQKQKDGN